jgi:hypothetical protein
LVNENEITLIVNFCQAHLDLAHVNLDDAYYYQSLPSCVIDAVFSIGVRYTSTENTVRRFGGGTPSIPAITYSNNKMFVTFGNNQLCAFASK